MTSALNRIGMTGLKFVWRSRVLGRAWRVLAVLHLAAQLFVWVPQNWARQDPDRDLIVYHRAARAALNHRPLYQPQPDYGPDLRQRAVYLYPPPFAAAIAPLGHLDFRAFARVWGLILLAAFWIYAWCLARLAMGRASLMTVLSAGLVLGMWPGSYRALALGQVDALLWMLFALALVHEGGRGALFSLATLIKMHAIWPLGCVLVREKRARLGALAVVVGALLLGGWVCGFEAYGQWARAVLPVVRQGSFDHDNVSLSMSVLRTARGLGWDYAGGPLQGWPRWWLTIAAIMGPLATAWLLRRREIRVQAACVGAMAIVCAPTCWTAYLPLLLAPLALWLHAQRSESSGDS